MEFKVGVSRLDEAVFRLESRQEATLSFNRSPAGYSLTISTADEGKGDLNLPCNPTDSMKVNSVGRLTLVITNDGETVFLSFKSENDLRAFSFQLKQIQDGATKSVFAQRTDDSSAQQYFQFYGYLSQQQNMMQDFVRTSTYQRAMLSNLRDFQDKVVLDVGAGSGILSFFAVQAGARRVYAVEASSMAQHCETLVRTNKLAGRVIVVAGKVEEIELPEPVDVIISEPMGYMLYNERMLETFLHARKWLTAGGRMLPTLGDLFLTPFTDEALYMEQSTKANFWYQQNFHGVDLSALREAAVAEYFKQPIVDTFDIRICMGRPIRHRVNFEEAAERDLYQIRIPFQTPIVQSGTVHGLAFWFDVAFVGSEQVVWLSTSPTEMLTHWYQVRCLLPTPVFVKQGQVLTGSVQLNSNSRQSYDVDIAVDIPGTRSQSCNSLDLKNPYFRYTGQAPQPPPGAHGSSPTEDYWQAFEQARASLQVHQQQQQYAAYTSMTQQNVMANGPPGPGMHMLPAGSSSGAGSNWLGGTGEKLHLQPPPPLTAAAAQQSLHHINSQHQQLSASVTEQLVIGRDSAATPTLVAQQRLTVQTTPSGVGGGGGAGGGGGGGGGGFQYQRSH